MPRKSREDTITNPKKEFVPEQDKEQSHLALQINLLTEQKIAKFISLVEELRTDLPNVNNQEDVEVMKQATDPQAILDVLQNNLKHPSTPHLEHKNHGT